MLNFLRDCQTFFFPQVTAPFYIPISHVCGFQFSHILSSTRCLSFEDSHAGECGVVPDCGLNLHFPRASLVAQMVKRQPAVQETWVQSLGWEDPLEKEMTTHSSTLAWKIPWTEEPGRL